MEKVRKMIEDLLNRKTDALVWTGSLLGAVEARLFLDKFVAKTNSPLWEPIIDLHNLLFFGSSFLLVWLVFSLALGARPGKLVALMSWANLFVIFPPIFDLVRTGGKVFWSFYLLSSPEDLFWQFTTFFGHLPQGIVYFGTRIVFVAVILISGGLIFVRTKDYLRTALGIFGIYLSLFFMASFPSIFAYFTHLFQKTVNFWETRPFQIVQVFSQSQILGREVDFRYSMPFDLNLVYFIWVVFLVGILFFLDNKAKFQAFLKNLRIPQLVFHAGLLTIGLGLGSLAYPENSDFGLFSVISIISLFLAIFLAWEASVVFNDISDFEIDKISNPERPLQKGIFTREEYRNFGIILFLLSLLGALAINVDVFLLLALYQVLAWAYSSFPFRMKRIPLLATFLSALTLMMVLFSGFSMFSGEAKLAGLSSRVVFLLIITYTICLPVKDFKDLIGDRKDGVKTIPVLFGEEKGRILVGTGFFLSYMLSVFLLNEMRLFYFALIFGGLSFWVVNNKKIAPKDLLGLGLGIVFVYALILAKIVFF